MSTNISMLRGINLGGHKRLDMQSLRQMYEDLGFDKIKSYLQSGNVIFHSQKTNRPVLVKRIESHLARTYGYSIAVFIRQAQDLQHILAANPFLNARKEDPGKLHVTFLYQAPSETAWNKLIPPANIPDEFASDELAIYLFCPHGYARTRLSNAFFERTLGMPVITPNWNTVNALYKLALES